MVKIEIWTHAAGPRIFGFLWLHPPFAAIFVNILAFKMLYCNRKQLI